MERSGPATGSSRRQTEGGSDSVGVISGGEPSEPADRPNEAAVPQGAGGEMCHFDGDS